MSFDRFSKFRLWQGLKQGGRKMPGQFPKADQRLCEKEHLLKGCRNPQQWQGSQGADLPLRQGGLQEQHGHQRKQRRLPYLDDPTVTRVTE